MLLETDVVAGDRASPDVGAGTHLGIADVRKMVCADSDTELGILHLDEVANFGAFSEVGSGSQMREGSNLDAGLEDRAGDPTLPNLAAVPDGGVGDVAVSRDAAV